MFCAASEAAELRKESVWNWDRYPSLLWWRLMGHEARRLNSAAFPDLHLTLLSIAVAVPKYMATIELYAKLLTSP